MSTLYKEKMGFGGVYIIFHSQSMFGAKERKQSSISFNKCYLPTHETEHDITTMQS